VVVEYGLDNNNNRDLQYVLYHSIDYIFKYKVSQWFNHDIMTSLLASASGIPPSHKIIIYIYFLIYQYYRFL